jgi:hypothetical protein
MATAAFMRKRPKLSVAGIVLAGLYVILSLAFVVYGISIEGDPKGKFVLMQLPIALQLALADYLGLLPMLSGLSWAAGYFFFFLPTIAMLYGLGWIFQRTFAAVKE